MTIVVSPPPDTSLDDFLAESELIHWSSPTVLAQATELGAADDGPFETAARCFRWVRDNVRHSSDFQSNPVTCTAAEVLEHRTGYCYAKSHLLAALLRANSIPAGFCYQRLKLDETRFCLHVLNAVYLDDFGWYRVDARGDRTDVTTDFSPPEERLAFTVQAAGECDFPQVLTEPLEEVVTALRSHATWDDMLANLPDKS
jgi:transglutaminase-like putative cysteine protease